MQDILTEVNDITFSCVHVLSYRFYCNALLKQDCHKHYAIGPQALLCQ